MDVMERIGSSLIQHGSDNNRVYVMKQGEGHVDAFLDQVEALAADRGYTKIFAKIPERYESAYLARGFVCEAGIPGFYGGKEDGRFMSRYLDEQRKVDHRQQTIDEILEHCRDVDIKKMGSLPEGFECRWAVPGDVEIMAELYREVFQSYPFPIHNPDYLLSTMQSHVAYFLVFNNKRLVAQSSAEMDEEASNAEMTDFATHPDCRGQGLASYLLHEMEQAMKKRGIRTAYTIARAVSWGMNKTFARLGYDFGGTLINNTQISGTIESMNIWYKTL